MAEETNVAATTDPAADFVAWEQAEKEGRNSEEPIIPEATSEPAGEPVKAEPAPVPEADASQETKPEEKSEAGEETDKGHAPKWFRELDKQRKRQIRELREQTEALRAELAERKTAEPAAAQPVKEPSVPVEPKEEDFEGHAEYIRALTAYHAKQTAAREIAEFQASVQKQLEDQDAAISQKKAAAAQAVMDAKWAKDVESGREKHPDFDEVVLEGQFPERGPVLDRVIWESEFTDEIMYHLAKNPEEILRIRALLPHQIGKEVGKLEAQFSGKAKSPETKLQVNSTPKPNPTTRIGGGNSMAAIRDQNDPEVLQDYPRWERMERERREKEKING